MSLANGAPGSTLAGTETTTVAASTAPFTPYVLFITMTQDETTTPNNPSTPQQLQPLQASYYPGYTDYTNDFASNEWQPSVVGLYSIYAQVFVDSPALPQPKDNLTQIILYFKQGTDILHSTHFRLDDATTVQSPHAPEENLTNYTVQIQTIVAVTQATVDANTSYHLALDVHAASGNAPVIYGYGGRYTYWTIHRIA